MQRQPTPRGLFIWVDKQNLKIERFENLKMKAKYAIIYFFGAAFIAGSFIMWYLFKDNTNPNIIGTIETLKAGDLLILGYFFGSSKGSADKTELMNNQNNA